MKNKAAQSLGRLGGLKTSEAKAASSAENGRLGGRPYACRQKGKNTFAVNCLAAHGYSFSLTLMPDNSVRITRYKSNGDKTQILPDKLPADVAVLFRNHELAGPLFDRATAVHGRHKPIDHDEEHSHREAAYDEFIADHGGIDPDERA